MLFCLIKSQETSSLQIQSETQPDATTEISATSSIESLPGDREEKRSIVTVIVAIVAVIAVLLLLVILAVTGIVILKVKRQKSSVQTCTSEHDLQTAYETGMPVWIFVVYCTFMCFTCTFWANDESQLTYLSVYDS